MKRQRSNCFKRW